MPVLLILGGVLVGVVLLAAGVGIFLLVGLAGDDDPAAVGTTASAVPSPSPSTAPTPSPPTPPVAPVPPDSPRSSSGPGDVRDQPAGLFCRDLNARGYGYSAAVDYWRLHGQPGQMDADGNGIPCETVYAATEVVAYWGPRDLPGGSPALNAVQGLPSGLLCRDLRARGYSYSDSVSYYWFWGGPDRMDADRNGIPCETVYSVSEVAAFWGP